MEGQHPTVCSVPGYDSLPGLSVLVSADNRVSLSHLGLPPPVQDAQDFSSVAQIPAQGAGGPVYSVNSVRNTEKWAVITCSGGPGAVLELFAGEKHDNL